MNLMGENAIRQLGVFYMSGISEQVSSHFGTAIELRLSQVESLVDAVPPGTLYRSNLYADRADLQCPLGRI